MIKIGSKVKAIRDGLFDCYGKGWIGRVTSRYYSNAHPNKELLDIEFENGNNINCCYIENFEEVKGMTKDELKNGMLVQMKDKCWGVVICEREANKIDKVIFLNNSFNHISLHDVNLENPKDNLYDIIKVATINHFSDLFKYATQLPQIIEKLPEFKVIWQAQSPELQQAIEQVKKAEAELQKAKEALEKLDK
jgi:hypothetical protein